MFQNVPQEIFIVSPYKQHLAGCSDEQLLSPTLGKLRQEDQDSLESISRDPVSKHWCQNKGTTCLLRFTHISRSYVIVIWEVRQLTYKRSSMDRYSGFTRFFFLGRLQTLLLLRLPGLLAQASLVALSTLELRGQVIWGLQSSVSQDREFQEAKPEFSSAVAPGTMPSK